MTSNLPCSWSIHVGVGKRCRKLYSSDRKPVWKRRNRGRARDRLGWPYVDQRMAIISVQLDAPPVVCPFRARARPGDRAVPSGPIWVPRAGRTARARRRCARRVARQQHRELRHAGARRKSLEHACQQPARHHALAQQLWHITRPFTVQSTT